MDNLAIIGTGIAGMGVAHHLHNRYNITLFEQNNYVGGHTNTIGIDEGDRKVFMDTGFMVFNFETYPHLCKLFKEINAPIKKTEMSFSVQYKPSGLEYCGSGINGLFAQRKNFFNIQHIRMLLEISRFNKTSVEILDNPKYEQYSLAEYMKEFKFSDNMLWKYLVPMSSAVWSTPMDKMLSFPAMTLIRFFKNHGFLGLNSQHQWYTLENGSQSYRELLIRPFKERIQTNVKVIKAMRKDDHVNLIFENGTSSTFDKVIFACHADQTLRILENPTADEKRILSTFKYQKNKATVHTDESVMPTIKKIWSSWNYKIEERYDEMIPTTIYWMNSLQQVSKRKNYFVSINALAKSINPELILKEIDYEHPLFDVKSVQAQKELYLLNEKGPVYFCGSYFKYGFHEDAYKSAVDLCKKL